MFLAAVRGGGGYAGTTAGGAVLVVGGTKGRRGGRDVLDLAGAYDRQPLGTVPLADLKEVAADRRLRLVIKPFLDADETQTQLADPDPAVRRGAAVKLGNQAAAGAAPVVEAAVEKDEDRLRRR